MTLAVVLVATGVWLGATWNQGWLGYDMMGYGMMGAGMMGRGGQDMPCEEAYVAPREGSATSLEEA